MVGGCFRASNFQPDQMPMPRGRPRLHVAPCKFCQKQFKRLEHLQRHERIRTQLNQFHLVTTNPID